MNKISVWGLNTLLATYLDGTFFFEEVLSKINFKLDEGKNVQDNVIDNLKSMIKVALRYAIKGDLIISCKLKQTLQTLLDYGTEDSSDNIRVFLNSQESKTPLIISGMPLSNAEKKFGNLFRPSREVVENYDPMKIKALMLLINSTQQNFIEE